VSTLGLDAADRHVDLNEPGPSERAWRSTLDRVPWSSPIGADGIAVVVAPHPDDETLGVGGLLADLFLLGWEVRVVGVTDGEAAHADADATARARLAARRRAEQVAALASLRGPSPAARCSITRLGIPDGEVAAAHDGVVDAVREALDGATWCLGPLAWDGHPDHEACAAAVAAACGDCTPYAEYPIWAWHWATPFIFPVERARRVALSPLARVRKAEALSHFASQYEERDDGPVVPPHVLARFQRPFEVLLP
jgi:LmbE family N-acetylglucosaminyl deacetylase